MRILGIDYGEKRIGIAVSDPLELTAQGIAVIENKGLSDATLLELDKIITRYDHIGEILVGLPKTLAGEIGIQAQKVLNFVAILKSRYKIPVNTWDERLTTAEAEKYLIEAGLSRQKRREVIDKSAAINILQSYLESRRKL